MEIWILVIVLLSLGILFLLISLFTGRNSQNNNQLNEYMVQQSEELFHIKSRIQSLEQKLSPVLNSDDDFNSLTESNSDESSNNEIETDAVTDNQHEEIIRLYSQGYTMHEIGQAVNLNVSLVQETIDDYIENR